jgi:hypothetical protein
MKSKALSSETVSSNPGRGIGAQVLEDIDVSTVSVQ